MTQRTTYAASLTPPGVAAIATLGVCGAEAWSIVRGLFRPRSASGKPLPDEPEPGRVWLGRFGDEAADEVVLAVKSAAPLPWLEVHCHGGREVVRLLLETLAAHGAEVCPWQHFQRLVCGDPLQAEAAAALAEARTMRTAAILLDQYHGAFSRAVTMARAALHEGDVAAAQRRLDDLCRFTSLGRHLTAPWTVVIAGAPNVGKSSLLNALAGYQRSIVSPMPGTTRDVVTALLAIDGWPVEFADTAGLHEGAGTLEGQGIERARLAAASADLCLWVLDASAPPVWPEAPSGHMRFVVNKIDLPSAWDLDEAANAIRVSARTGQGLPELCGAIGNWLVPEVPATGTPLPFTPRLCDRVEEARRCVLAGAHAEAARLLGSLLVDTG